MADFLPKFLPGQAVTFTASADVTGGRLVEVTGDRTVGPAAADSEAVIGTAGYDAKTGEQVTVYTPYGVHVLVAAATIAAGKHVAAATGGKVSGVGNSKIGVALTGGDEDDLIEVLMGVDRIDSSES